MDVYVASRFLYGLMPFPYVRAWYFIVELAECGSGVSHARTVHVPLSRSSPRPTPQHGLARSGNAGGGRGKNTRERHQASRAGRASSSSRISLGSRVGVADFCDSHKLLKRLV